MYVGSVRKKYTVNPLMNVFSYRLTSVLANVTTLELMFLVLTPFAIKTLKQ